MVPIIPAKTDFAFKYVFANERNKDILVAFLKTVLDLPDEDYNNIEIVDPQLARDFDEDKSGIVDVKITTATKKTVHVEIQLAEQRDIQQRITYYNAKLFSTQITAGMGYHMLNRVISIIIVDFNLIKNSCKYHHKFRMTDVNGCIELNDLLEINILELPKLPPAPDGSGMYDWLKFMSTMSLDEMQSFKEKGGKLQKAAEAIMYLSSDAQSQKVYEHKMLTKATIESIYAFYEEKGRAIGIERGLKQGIAEAQTKIVKNLLLEGYSTEKISSLTGLSSDEITKISEAID